MADKAISDLTAATQINDNDLFVLEQNGTAKKLLMALWKDYIEQAFTLPIDSTPTENSNNLVTSGGVYTAIAAKSAVAVSSTGTATDEVWYITIDGTEKKLGGVTKQYVDEQIGTLDTIIGTGVIE